MDNFKELLKELEEGNSSELREFYKSLIKNELDKRVELTKRATMIDEALVEVDKSLKNLEELTLDELKARFEASITKARCNIVYHDEPLFGGSTQMWC
jgi:hypothetical protein